ncbi:MAG: PAS domain S-box protein [Rubrivivax sp.]|nr:PAS domain S-box protein [Rubrivivax sp.]
MEHSTVERGVHDPLVLDAELEQLLSDAGQARAWAENQAAVLTAAVEAMPDGVLVADLQGVHRCNAAALLLLGVESLQDLQAAPAELVARLRLRPEKDGPLLPAHELPLEQARNGSTQVRELWATRSSDGKDVLLRCAAAPIRIDGQSAGMVAVLSDLTQRLQMQEQRAELSRTQSVLQERHAELRAMVDGIRDHAILTLDKAGHIVSWYRGAELMKGYTAEEATGMHFSQLFTPEDREHRRAEVEMAVAAEVGEFKGEGERQRKDGSRFEAAVLLTALRDDSGELRGFIKLTQDISARRRVEREREVTLRDARAARAEAERANHSKGEFLATISHELRTPLSAMLGWAQVLELGGHDTETVRHGLNAISRNARMQLQLIEDLLDMNRIELGQLRLDLQPVELGDLLAAALDSAMPAASAKGVGLRAAAGTDPISVMGDSARLLQVMGNLLSNAIKFTPSGGQVSVTLSRLAGHAQVAVADSGQGIGAQFLSRLFDRFQQQDATITRRHGGLGIGLAIVRHLAHLHGGAVQAHSPGVGQGATFTVVLPTVDSHTPNGLAAGVAAPTRLDGVSVLLVEDDPDLRAATARLLQEAGAQVVLAAGALEALQGLTTTPVDVILSDIGMPETDGYELMRRVRRLPPDQGGATPAAAFTAYTRAEDVADALAAGYQLHLAKPVTPAALVSAVATLLAASGPSARPATQPAPQPKRQVPKAR